MADTELIEQIRAQVKSLKSPRHSTPGRGTTDTTSSGSSSRGRLMATVSGPISGRTSSSNNRAPSTPRTIESKSITAPATTVIEGIIVLDVGGVKYRTTTNTLKCIESCYFSHLLNGVWDPPRTEEGHIFIDRNGQLFAVVLEYLRNCVHNDGDFIELPIEVSKLKALKREADFYLLPGLSTQINSVLQEQEAKERFQNELDTASSVVVKEEENSDKEFDLIFHSVSNSQCSFPEDRLQDLVNRVNYSLASKETEGYKINSSTSDLIFDATKTCPYIIFVQITLIRDRKLSETGGRGGFQLPVSTPPLERTRRTSPHQLPLCPYVHPESSDLGSNEGLEYLSPPPPPPQRRATPPKSPRLERQISNNYRYQQPNEFQLDSTYSTQMNIGDPHRCNLQPRWNYRPRFVDQGEWEASYELVQQQSLSPRDTGHYQPTGSHFLQRKSAAPRSPFTRPGQELPPSNSYKVRERVRTCEKV
eukprot:g556.t1